MRGYITNYPIPSIPTANQFINSKGDMKENITVLNGRDVCPQTVLSTLLNGPSNPRLSTSQGNQLASDSFKNKWRFWP